MITKEFINLIAAQTGMSKRKTEELLSATSAILGEALQNGQSVQMKNFGVLEVKERPARTIVHPKTGEKCNTKAKMVATFRPTAALKEKLKNA